MSDEQKKKRVPSVPSRDSTRGQTDRDVGHALRTVYSVTVNEEIPPELLDLLGKLD